MECYRVELPRGADVNDIAVQAKDARAALGSRKAVGGWAPPAACPAAESTGSVVNVAPSTAPPRSRETVRGGAGRLEAFSPARLPDAAALVR